VQLLGPGRMEDRASVEEVPRFFAEDVELLQMRSIVGTGGRFLGRRGVREATLEILREFADAMFVPQEVRVSGDRVGTRAVFRGKGRRSGAPVEIEVGHLFTMREEMIVRWEVFEDPAAALKSLGPAE
jgi:ketosteroid isomerase-like protein